MRTRLHPLVRPGAAAALALLYLPMIAVVVFSVNSSRYGLVWRGFTLDWYVRLFRNETILEAARNTLLLAAASTAISTPLGTMLALGLVRHPWSRRARGALELILYLPLLMPDILFAAALVVIFGVLRPMAAIFEPGLVTMILAHVTFQIAFVALVVAGRMKSIGSGLEEAARDLYADGWTVFRRVTLPLLAPGIAAGAMLAFTLSLDDFVISFFTAGPDSTTLPIYIYASVRRGVTPEIHALSVLMFLLSVGLVLAFGWLTRPRKD